MPASPTSPARLPSTPTSSKRAPQRLKLTPKRHLHTPKRLPHTPQPPTKPMTPKRNPHTAAGTSRRRTKDAAAPLKTPKRDNRETPAADNASCLCCDAGPAPTRSAQRATRKKSSTVRKDGVIAPSRSQASRDVGKGKKERRNENSETDAHASRLEHAETILKAPSSPKKLTIPPSPPNSTVKKSSSKKLTQSSKHRDVDEFPRVGSAPDEEETPKKRKSKKKRPAPGKFDMPTEDRDGSERSPAKRSKKGSQKQDDGTLLSPKITVNESMTESKLQLLESSPLNRLIAENDRKAAAAEVASQKNAATGKGKKGGVLGSSDSFVAVERSTADTDRANERKAPVTVVKKEGGKKKGKSKEASKEGSLLDKDDPEGANKQGVMYLGHIPHGFYEKQMKSYFSQFGTVTKLKLSRSKKTGGSRGYAFLEFADPEVASIAAEAMDGYLMHGQSLVAKVVPDDKVHPDTFKDADKRFKKVPWSSVERRKMIARAKDPLKLAVRSRRVKKVAKNRMRQLSKKGIKYDFPEVSA